MVRIPKIICSLVFIPAFAAHPAKAVTFDFGNTMIATVNNSQNGGTGNWVPFANETTAISTSANTVIGGIRMTLVNGVASNGNGTADEFWAINEQGIGIITDNRGGQTDRRIDGALGESLVFKFDKDVTLVSARFGSFAGGETAIFTPQGGAAITVTAPAGTQTPTNDESLGNVFVAANTPITLSGGSPTSGGFLFNEITVTEGGISSGNLVTTHIASFPAPTVVANPAAGANPGSTAVAPGIRKAQSFSLASETQVSGLVFEIASVATAGSYELQIARGMDGLPWLAPVVSESGSLPINLPSTGGLIQINLPTPVTLPRGTWTVSLTGTAANFALRTSEGAQFPKGALSRKDASTGNFFLPVSNPASDAVFGVLGTQQTPPPVPTGKPNIVFILADDLGWTDIQCGPTGPNVLNGTNHGSTYHQTPNLARLASSGLSFSHCFVNPNCAPTRAALISGQYPSRSGNGVYAVDALNRGSGTPTLLGPAQGQDIPVGHVIWSEALQQAGYVTAHLGKYHLANHEEGAAALPEFQGFDYNFGGKDSGNPGSFFATGGVWNASVGPGLAAYAAPYTQAYVDAVLKGPSGDPLHQRALGQAALFPNASANNPDTLVGTSKHLTDAVGDAATAFIRDHSQGDLSARPFFMQVHFFAVHTPIQPRPDLVTKYGPLPTSANHDDVNYAALLEGMDQNVGRILDRLDDPNGDGNNADSVTANTLVVFLSDNGGLVGITDNNPLRHSKGSFWNGGLRVPMIVRQPGTVPSASLTDTLVHAVDFYPSLLGHAGVPLPAGIHFDGESFAAHMINPTTNPRDRGPIYYHFPGYLDVRARPVEVAIARIGGSDYKLIYNQDLSYTGNPTSAEDVAEGLDVLSDPWELYRFSDDVSETNDLLDGRYSNQLLYGEIADEMAAGLRNWLTQSGADWFADPLTVRATGAIVPNPEADIPDVTVPFTQSFRLTTTALNSQAGEISLTWSSEPGFIYDIEVSGALGTWEPLLADVVASASVTSRTVPDEGITGAPKRFYRVVLKR
jgi:arylsulfatase A-like enzyme